METELNINVLVVDDNNINRLLINKVLGKWGAHADFAENGRQAVEKTLQVLGLIDLIEVIVCAGETEKGKPHPDPFLAAAYQLNISPKDCLVFEDGAAGEEAARRAGMQCIRIDKL